MSDAEDRRWYGESRPVTPAQVGEILAGFDGPWWVSSGWAIEAFTGVHRDHGDIDIGILRPDADRLCRLLGDRYTAWSAHEGALIPVRGDVPVHPETGNVWFRPDARSPWELDVLLNPEVAGRWVNRRWPAHTAAVDEVTWLGADGIRYLQPEVALFFKAKHRRPKDDADLDAAAPLLSDTQRAWLRDALRAVHPGHDWIRRVSSQTTGGTDPS